MAPAGGVLNYASARNTPSAAGRRPILKAALRPQESDTAKQESMKLIRSVPDDGESSSWRCPLFRRRNKKTAPSFPQRRHRVTHDLPDWRLASIFGLSTRQGVCYPADLVLPRVLDLWAWSSASHCGCAHLLHFSALLLAFLRELEQMDKAEASHAGAQL